MHQNLLFMLIMVSPSAKSMRVLLTTLYAICHRLVFLFNKLSTDKVMLTPMINMNHGNTKSATVKPEKESITASKRMVQAN